MVLIAANWKMHGSLAFVDAYFASAATLSWPDAQQRIVFPPATLLGPARAGAAAAGMALGAQSIHGAVEGAFTGSLSAEQVAEVGAAWVLLGHSERRAQGEADDDVIAQLGAADRAGLKAMICLGEPLPARRAGEAEAFVLAQLEAVLAAPEDALRALAALAYEPIWAIGTGETATPAQAQAMHRCLREALRSRGLGSLPLLYGGSVKADNAGALLSQDDIDGALVGGASLELKTFHAIARAAIE